MPGETNEKESVAKKSAAGALLNMASAGIAKISSLLFYIIMLRFVSAEEGGVYFLSLATGSLISVFVAFGMGDSLSRFIPFYEGKGEKWKIKPLVYTVFVAFIITSIVAMACSFLFKDAVGAYYNKDLAAVLPITVAIGVSLSLSSVLFSTLMGLMKFGDNALYSAGQAVLKIALAAVFFLYFGSNVGSALNATIISINAVNLAIIAVLFGTVWKMEGRFELLGRKESYEVAKYGMSAALNQIGSSIMFWTDTLVMGYCLPSAVIGAYNTITSMARTAMYTFIGQVFSILTSMLSHLHGAKSEIFGSLASNATRWNSYVTLPIAVISVFFAREITTLLFPVYAEYFWLLYLFIPGTYIGVISSPARSALSAIGRSDLIFKCTLSGIVPNLILNIIFVPIYGIIGATVSTIATMTFSDLIAIYYARREAKFTVHPLAYRAILPAAVMGIILVGSYELMYDYSGGGKIMMAIGMGLASALSCLVYFIILAQTRLINETDRMIMDKTVAMGLRMIKLDKILRIRAVQAADAKKRANRQK